MEDKSFVDLLSEENLSKINIDPRLVDSFKRVIKKMQVYFNSNGYTSERNYQEFFNEYLLNPDSSKNLSFFLNDEPSKIGAGGFYTNDGKRICIDESNTRTNENLDSTLCHEFIHFLVMRGIINEQTADPQIRFGGFINEALTEMLNRQMYPNSSAYEPQVSMMEFANLLSNNVNNYSLFLKGHIDAKGYGAASWNNFVANAKAYQEKWHGKPFRLVEARKDELYIEAQRKLINSKISAHLIKSFSDYVEKIDILMKRPAPDDEYIEKFFENMDRYLIVNLGLKTPELSSILMKKLQDYRDLSASYAKYNNKDIYEFEIAGRKIGIDKDRNLYGALGLTYQSSWNPNTGMYEFKVGNEVVKLDINKIDFEKWKKDVAEKQQNIAKYFSSNSKEDVKSVEQVAKQEGLVKLEKFTLPSIGGKKNPTVIYVATYGDRIEILNSPTQIGELENIKSAQYIGVTSADPKVGAIYSKPLDSIDNGIVFSKHNQKYLQSRTIHLLASKLTPTLSSEQITQLVEQYKSSDEYDVEDNLSPKQLQEFAIMHYAKVQYGNMPEEQKQALYDEVVKANERFVISTKDGKIDVSLLFGDKYITAFRGQSEVLVDTKGNGLYNEQFEILSKATTVKKESNPSVIKTGDDGNIIFSPKKGSEEKSMSEEKKTYSEFLNEYNQQLAELQAKYGVIAKQMEDLMQQNAATPIPNYQDKLNVLIQQGDKIIEKMAPVIHSQRAFQQAVDYEREQQHKAVISQVERLLSIRIKGTADTGRFIKTDMGMFPQMDLKDKSALRDEQGNINKRLDELYYDGQLDIKTWQSMKSEVGKEYEKLIAKAPTPHAKKEEEKINTSNPNQTPSKPHTSRETREEVVQSDMGKVEQTFTPPKPKKTEETDKTKLEEQRRELRRKQFQERRKAMGLDFESDFDLDNLLRQQELIERQRIEMEAEEIEHHNGMRM